MTRASDSKAKPQAPVGADAKLPYQQVYWDNYVNHKPLRLCSLAARGLWPDILAICWDAKPRGHFLINGTQPTTAQLANIAGIAIDLVAPALAELEAKGVFSRTDAGVIYCRRMVNDEAKRLKKLGLEAPTETEQELRDRCIRDGIDAVTKAEDKKAAARARTSRWRQKQRAAKALDQMRAFAAMETATALSEVTSPPAIGDVTQRVTVTSPPPPVTRHSVTKNVTQTQPVQRGTPGDAPASNQSPSSRLKNIQTLPSVRDGPAQSLATLTGGSLAGSGEGVKALQSRIVPGMARPLVQSPSETIEAFDARCAAQERRRA